MADLRIVPLRRSFFLGVSMPDPIISLYDTVRGNLPGELTVRLFTAFDYPGGVPQLSQFSEANFPGYTQKFVTDFSGRRLNGDGSYSLDFGWLRWTVGLGNGSPGTVLGYYLTIEAAAGECVCDFDYCPNEVPMTEPGNYLQFNFNVNVGQRIVQNT